MPRKDGFASPDDPGDTVGRAKADPQAELCLTDPSGAVRPGGAVVRVPRARASRPRTDLVKLLAAGLLSVLLFSSVPAVLSSAGIHFGLVSAVKSKVKELSKKVRARMAPGSLAAVAVSSTTINLTWKDNTKDELGFQIERKRTATGAYAQVAVLPPNTVSYNDTGLTGNTTYYYRMRAYNSSVESDYSNEASAVTRAGVQLGAALAAEPPVIATGAVSILTCVPDKPDDPNLVYTWTAGSGTITGSGASVSWKGPLAFGNYQIYCELSDPAGLSQSTTTVVTVIVSSRPVIASFNVSPSPTSTGTMTTIDCQAFDPQGGGLKYVWHADSGTLIGDTESVKWRAPKVVGKYIVSCTVTDVLGGTDSKTTIIEVKIPLIEAETKAVPPVILPSHTSSITCLVTKPDPAQVTMSYVWSSDTGRVAGSGKAATWTAPAALGTYEVKCSVSDPADGSQDQSVHVVVSTVPAIVHLTSDPETVGTSSTATINCEAYSPDPAYPIATYNWIVGSGTISGHGSEVTWTAPAATGTYMITSEVLDSRGWGDRKTLLVLVNNLALKSIRAVPPVVSTGEISVLISTVSDPGNSVFTYYWTPDAGTINGTGGTVNWTAPGSTGTYSISCDVTDEAGALVNQSVSVIVASGPVIYSFTASTPVASGSYSELICLATAPHNEPLTYDWNSASGTIAGTGDDVKWTAPIATGNYVISCTVRDGSMFVSSSIVVLVNNLAITSLLAEPTVVSTGAVSAITCTATDPGVSALVYNWTLPEGTVAGTDSILNWRAPASTGTYSIGCEVSDDEGGKASKAVDVLVATGPVIRQFNLSPSVSTGSVANIVCVATAPGGQPLTYAWSPGVTITGTNGEAKWTAPLTTGTYTLDCKVTDWRGVWVSSTVTLLVNNLQIQSLKAVPPVVSTGGISVITCIATDPGFPVLTYTWTSPVGTTVGTSNTLNWTAPASTGTYSIFCTVKDDAGGMAQNNVPVIVATGPVIVSFNVPEAVPTSSLGVLKCVALSPSGGPLSYDWKPGSGTITGAGDTVHWLTPDATGSYLITCKVTDDKGVWVSSTVAVLVNDLDIVLSADPTVISTGEASVITCAVTDPGSPALTYSWNPTGGALSGSGGRVTWTAPASTGVYSISCMVTDDAGGKIQRSIDVRVSTGPEIISFTAPAQVATGTISDVICVATAPGGQPLTYVWTSVNGTTSPGTADDLLWTAPVATGAYTINCKVTDWRGLSVSSSVAVLVDNIAIKSLTAAPAMVSTGTVSVIICTATDPGFALNYTWILPEGTVAGTSNTLNWVSPASTGTYTIFCKVNDDAGGTAQKNIDVTVSTAPVIISLSAEPEKVGSNATSLISCQAQGPGDGALSYTWYSASGTISGTADKEVWTAPAATGTYLITCAVRDAAGVSVSSSVAVLVNNPPMISSLKAVPAVVSMSSVTVVTCTAADPDNPVLFYSWLSSTGTLAGSSASLHWTAPEASGTYTITCEVSDGEGGVATKNLDITVSSVPVIRSLFADPAKVSTGAVANITCEANGAGDGSLTYHWSSASGTISGTADKEGWTAPDSTGTFMIYCEVTDANGSKALAAVNVLVDNPPVISSVTANPPAVKPGETSVLTCTAHDPDNPVLYYKWTPSSGTITGSAATEPWTAPDATGTYTITCEVSDGEGGIVQKSVDLVVSSVPVIISLTAEPVKVSTGGVSTLTCKALAPDNGVLTYSWTPGSGTITGAATGAAVSWTAPDSTGTYMITCAVSAAGQTASGSVTVLVNNPPVIVSLAADPPMVSMGLAAAITCVTKDPGNPSYTYTWVPSSGTITGSGASVSWTAPASSGAYVILCDVSDDQGGDAQQALNIIASSLPVITSLTADPLKISTGGAVALSCAAQAPDDLALHYAWTSASGTVAGTGASATWTAPDSTGTYTLACTVTAGTRVAVRSVNVLVDNPPVIASLAAVPPVVSTGEISVITCMAHDPDNPVLFYKWTPSSGSITGADTGSSVSWVAPASSGTYMINCEVSDGEGGIAQQSVAVLVSSVPVISSLTADPVKVSTGASATLTCVAQGAGALSYSWIPGSGTIAGAGTGSVVSWTAPDSTGTYLIACVVSAGSGSARQSVNVLVNNPPVISSITVSPAMVSMNSAAVVACVAADPDNPVLFYNWNTSSGTISGSGASVSWTAPTSSGTYTIGCEVSDGEGGSTQQSVNVAVSSMPVITSLTARPEMVSTGAPVALDCIAQAPDNQVLSYSWVPGSGTIIGTGAAVSWMAPAATGTYKITCNVSAGGHTVGVSVNVVANNPPVILSLAAAPAAVSMGHVSAITCLMADPGNPDYSYTWTPSSGTLTGSGASVTWTAPASSGTYMIACEVADGDVGTVQRSVDVIVSSLPVIKTLNIQPAKVSTGAVAAVSCVALGPDNAALTYNWSAASGTINGTGANVNWTAPDSTGTYSITCEASDAAGVTGRNVSVLVDNPPVISSMAAVPAALVPLSVSTITCWAHDPDNPVIFYDWTPDSGTLTGSGAEVYWTAPADTGTYAIKCEVTDGEGGSAQQSVHITVSSLPVINSISATPTTVSTGAVATLNCSAYSPADGTVSYNWSSASGTVQGVGTAGQAIWTAPDSTGTFRITCQVSDSNGSVYGTVNVLVNNPPVIDSLSANPLMVSPLAVSTATCLAHDPDNPVLFYNWTDSGGTYGTTAAAWQVKWTAPQDTGTYYVNCAVSDGEGGIAQRAVQILVSSVPVITQLSVEPDKVSTGTATAVTCVALGPDNAALSYDWIPGSGTITGTGASVNWTAPASTGTYMIICQVSAAGHTASRSVNILVNNPPVISSLLADPHSVEPSAVSTVTCTAHDPDNPDLSYVWTTSSGAIAGTGAVIYWTAPSATGTYTVSCEVSDGEGGSAHQTTDVYVNDAPTIDSLTASPTTVSTGAPAGITCNATDPDGDSLQYNWTAGSGTISGNSGGVIWTAPDSTGTYTITCQVTDGRGGSAQKSVNVVVNNPPIISSLAADPMVVLTGGISNISCAAHDPDNPVLFYAWTAASGTISGTGDTVAWTAPGSTGSYIVDCRVTDGEGGLAEQTVEVVVSSMPVISSLTAAPDKVSTGTVSNLLCVAHDPGNGSLVYTWTAGSGTINGTGAAVTWTAPDSTGTSVINCEVVDLGGASAQRSVSILVDNPPVISTLTAVPSVVLPSAVSTITCTAHDPDNPVIFYDWTAGSGTITGSGTEVYWAAPAATGTYKIGCTVSDGEGGEARQSVTVTVRLNGPPVIMSLMAAPATVSAHMASLITCSAMDPENDVMRYAWTAGSGTITGSGAAVNWTAPLSTGSYTVNCEVSDPFGGSVSSSVLVAVNNPPVISALTAAPSMVSPLAASTLTCTAHDPDDPVLGYAWTADSGTITGTGAVVQWTAPSSSGSYTVSCEAFDGEGGNARRSVDLTVSSVPVVTSFTVLPVKVSTGAAVTVECQALVPDNAVASYSWIPGSGTLNGSGTNVTWTAPASTGTYLISCLVTAVPGGGAVTVSTTVLVNNPPVIDSLTAAPAMVSPLAISTMTCAAHDPDNPVLDYNWTMTGGTASGTGAEVYWTAPAATGSYTVNCAVSDGEGGQALKDAHVVVSSLPVITSISVNPTMVSTGAAAGLSCLAVGPDNDVLTYNWIPGSGTVTGSGASAVWTAPASTGTYMITCQVTAAGQTASAGVTVRVNDPPVITSLTADPGSVAPSGISSVTCSAYDPDNDPLTYAWSATTGTITGTGAQVSWTAPDMTGNSIITCEITDGNGGSALKTVSIGINRPPVITSLQAVPPSVSTAGVSVIACSASDPDGDALSYDWHPGSGTITGFGATVSWNAPDSTGTYMVRCDVSDGRGGAAQRTVNVQVNDPPVITALTAAPDMVPPLSVSTITCVAHDPDNSALGYVWSAGSGTITGTGAERYWAAPAATGTYTITCAVSDGDGGQDQKNVYVLVSSVPVITSVTAVPGTVTSGGTVSLNCAARAPGNGSMTYNWTAASGTVTGTGAAASWTAPASTGTYTINCQVTDILNGKANAVVSVFVNNPPVILSLTPAPAAVEPLQISTITCSAHDPDNPVLFYNWTAASGTITGTGSVAYWTAPASTGSYAITCDVTDGEGGADRRSVIIADRYNGAPAITSITAAPANVSTGAVSALTCQATDPDGDTLSYAWSAGSGTITGTLASENWTAPASTGVYTINCVVTDGYGGSVSSSVVVNVNNPPVITSLSFVPDMVSPLAVSAVTCAAHDPDNQALAYNWAIASGTITGTGGSVTWTAPASSGTYTIACTVSDGAGGSDYRSGAVTVSSVPIIDSLNISPVQISTSDTATVICGARGPDNLALTYDWHPGSGTITGTGANVTWTPPSTAGTYKITCAVSAGGGVAWASSTALVDNPPRISSLSADPTMVSPLAISTVTCTAHDPDNPVLNYAWTMNGAPIAGTGAALYWTAPASTGSYSIGCAASDDGGGLDQKNVTVVVSSMPVITSLSIDYDKVSTGAVANLNCVAAAPDNAALTYTWLPGSGTVTGTSSAVTWTAPDSTGTYMITCQVSAAGHMVSRTVNVLVNNPPEIKSLTAAPPVVDLLAVSTLTCVATNPDNAVLAYVWTPTSGTINGTGAEVYWTAPDSTGTYTITCTVSDGVGGVAQDHVTVSARGNTAPVITSVTALPATIPSGGQTVLACAANDVDGDVMAYNWAAASGTVTGTTASVTWTAPAATGTYLISCTVTDGFGGSAQRSVVVPVNDPPVINTLTAAPSTVSPLADSVITCDATDPDHLAMTYAWAPSSGTITGTGASVHWTAPTSTGTYDITCTVSDVNSSAQKNVTMIVSSMPVVDSLIIAPVKVSSGAVATASCAAHGPDGGALTYNWTAGSGTIVGTAADATWTAPSSTGTYLITCAVTAVPGGGVVTVSTTILVNNPPVILSLTPNPVRISPLLVSTITCSAHDPDNPVLFYNWAATYGSVTGTGSQIMWTAPASSGSYKVNCGVSDGEGGSAALDVTLVVSSMPLITSMSASPDKVSTGAVTTLTCNAVSPDNDTLNYTWTTGSGTLTSTGAQATWTAPASTGTIIINCKVTAATGLGVAYSTMSILVNNPPVVQSLNAFPTSLSTGAVSAITCTARDPDNPVLFYTWSASSGTISGTGAAVNWTAPGSSGTYTLNCSVADGEGGVAQQSVQLTVTINGTPVIHGLTATPDHVLSSGASIIACDATDPDDPVLNYIWTVGSGTIVGSGTMASVTWNAPAATGTYMINCEATDGHGGNAYRSVNVLVNNPPSINTLVAAPALMQPLTISTITCSASDIDNPVLFSWASSSGTVLGSSNVLYWHAPASTGTYSVTVTAYDGEGGVAQRSVTLTVSSMAVVSLTATPAQNVPTGSLVSVHCAADMPGGGAMTYTWTAASGTITGTGADATWTAPASTGSYLVNCKVSSGGSDAFVSKNIDVNNPPAISDLSANPAAVAPAAVSTITCTAHDPENGPLTYTWSVSSGTWGTISSGEKIKWTAPSASTGVYTITCDVKDVNNGQAESFVTVTVSSTPIVSLAASPTSLVAGGQSAITCTATDPYNDALTYAWAAASGSITGTGSAVTWNTASDISSGTYVINCTVSDQHAGGVTQKNISVFVGGVTLWTKQLGTAAGDEGKGLAMDSSGNVYITGDTGGTLGSGGLHGLTDVFLTRYNAGGSNPWTVQLGTTGFYTNGTAVAVDASSHVFVAGYTNGPLDGNSNLGGPGGETNDFFLVKYSTAGVKYWTKQMGTTDEDFAYGVALDTSGNVYVVGDTAGDFNGFHSNLGSTDIFLAKYDNNGNELWRTLFGSAGDDHGRGVAIDPSGNVFLTGFTNGSIDANTNPTPGLNDIVIAKYTSAGGKLWVKQYGTSSSDTGLGIAIDASSNVFITGYTTGDYGGTHIGTQDAFVAKFDNNGNQSWVKQLGTQGTWNAIASGNAIAVDASGNVFYTGGTYGGNGFDGHSVTNNWDIILAKYDSAGTKVWTKVFGGVASDSEDKGLGVATNSSGDVFTTGYTTDTLPDANNTNPNHNPDIFLTKHMQ